MHRTTEPCRVGALGLGGLVCAAVAATGLVAACPGPVNYDFLQNPQAPPQMQTACKVMVQKCSRCHDPERFSVYRPESPGRVRTLVDRMRRLQGSNIDVADGETITDCLVYRNFGNEGLEALHGVAPVWAPPDGDGDGEEDGADGAGGAGDGGKGRGRGRGRGARPAGGASDG